MASLPSLVTIIAVPLSAISALAPVIPTRADRKSLRSSVRASPTCSTTSSVDTRRPVASENVSPTCRRLRWIAGITMWEGVSPRSWTIHSPRSVSTARTPPASRTWLRLISSLTIDLLLTRIEEPVRRQSPRTYSDACSAVAASTTTAPLASACDLKRANTAAWSRMTASLAARRRDRRISNSASPDPPSGPVYSAKRSSRLARQPRWNASRLRRSCASPTARR